MEASDMPTGAKSGRKVHKGGFVQQGAEADGQTQDRYWGDAYLRLSGAEKSSIIERWRAREVVFGEGGHFFFFVSSGRRLA